MVTQWESSHRNAGSGGGCRGASGEVYNPYRVEPVSLKIRPFLHLEGGSEPGRTGSWFLFTTRLAQGQSVLLPGK
jgi:hypothetical protein